MSYSGHIIRVEKWWRNEEGKMTLERRADSIIEELEYNADRMFDDACRLGLGIIIQSSNTKANKDV